MVLKWWRVDINFASVVGGMPVVLMVRAPTVKALKTMIKKYRASGFRCSDLRVVAGGMAYSFDYEGDVDAEGKSKSALAFRAAAEAFRRAKIDMVFTELQEAPREFHEFKKEGD